MNQGECGSLLVFSYVNLKNKKIKELLEEHSTRINCTGFIAQDPVLFPRRYALLQDIEVAGLLTAINAWGRRDMILRDVDKMLSIMGPSPFDFVMTADLDKFKNTATLHRTFNQSDLSFICRGLRAVYTHQASLEDFFIGRDMFDGIASMRQEVIAANRPEDNRSAKHLANPAAKSACKRLHLFLRWMVRRDGIVDLGVWRRLSPADLYIPLDTHVARIARSMGLLTRKQNDRQAVEELTALLRCMDANDPILYDFGLFGIGVADGAHLLDD